MPSGVTAAVSLMVNLPLLPAKPLLSADVTEPSRAVFGGKTRSLPRYKGEFILALNKSPGFEIELSIGLVKLASSVVPIGT